MNLFQLVVGGVQQPSRKDLNKVDLVHFSTNIGGPQEASSEAEELAVGS